MESTHNLSSANKVKASEHSDYWRYTLIGFLLPIIGVILGIVYLSKDKQVDKKLGEHLLAISTLFIIVWGTILGFLAFNTMQTTTPTKVQQQTQAITDALNAASKSDRDTKRQVD